MSNRFSRRGFGDDWQSGMLPNTSPWWGNPGAGVQAGSQGGSGNYQTIVAAGILQGGGGRALTAAQVRSVQSMLNSLPSSLPQLRVDGVFGARTQARLQEYQRQIGTSATGILDSATMASLAAGIRGASRTTPSGLPSAYANAYPDPNAGAGVPFNAQPPGSTNWTSWIVYGGLGLVAVVLLKELA